MKKILILITMSLGLTQTIYANSEVYHQIYVITDFGFMKTTQDIKDAQQHLSELCSNTYGGNINVTETESIITKQGLITFGKCYID